ncbi:MAG: response regulator [Candidatus Omnitrophica bacterium]|nr:response regulator [Candidatus Omnitrophota bacterium]
MSVKILVVDDDREILQMLSLRLGNHGYDVETACNGREGVGAFIESCHKVPYDLILLDIIMPDMEGREVLEIIRKEEDLRGIKYGFGIPIVMLTALKEPWFDSFEKGCDDYVIKPCSAEKLIAKIEEKLQEQEG